MDEVILVDEWDNPIGTLEKIKAHETGQLHRAFSIFIFNSKGDMLIQQRADKKYHSGGLWSNACCSHPRPNEDTIHAAHRRLQEELGIAIPLRFLLSFKYKTTFENGLIEHELDHVFVGQSDTAPKLNLEEASDYRYTSPIQLRDDIDKNPGHYTFWFKEIVNEVIDNFKL